MRAITKVFLSIFILILFEGAYAGAKDHAINVVTSFSILEDLVNELGGQHVNVVNLVDRNTDAHMYRPKPSDSIAISQAELVVFNGLGFEGWMARLVENTSTEQKYLIASEGVNPIILGEEVDPHAWQSFQNIRRYIENITQTLVSLRPQYKEELIRRQKQYLEKLNALENSLISKLEEIQDDKRVVVTSHDAFGYLGQEFNIQFYAPRGVNMEVEASAADVAEVINQIREKNVKALFVENITSPRLLKRISLETNVAIGGSLHSDALGELGGSADTYLKMMQHNLQSLINSFSAR